MNVTAAPILRYSDPRLYGTFLVQPWSMAYEWTRTVTNPWPPACNPVVECAVRGFKIVSGLCALAATCVPALAGRLVQMGHYHSMSTEKREKPRPIGPWKTEETLRLNIPAEALESCALPSQLFYAKTAPMILSTMRFGFSFDDCYGSIGCSAGPAIYASEKSRKAEVFGNDVEELQLSLDLKPEEIAYVPTKKGDAVPAFAKPIGRIGGSEALKARRNGFIMNGYRAVKFNTEGYPVWAIYDPSCIRIKK